jgi:redox-sensitive bicupin YhaK (pirin superfamily)
MTAGSGLVHAELSPDQFKRVGGPLEILQLWVNLPARLKMTPPRYTGVQRETIPAIAAADGKATVNLISGQWGEHAGPIDSLTGVFMTTVDMQAGARLAFDDLAGRNVFLYGVSGAATVNGAAVAQHTLVELDLPGDALTLETASGARFLFGHGDPIGEPAVAYGPFVMNTEAEIRQAIADYQAGKFGAVQG